MGDARPTQSPVKAAAECHPALTSAAGLTNRRARPPIRILSRRGDFKLVVTAGAR